MYVDIYLTSGDSGWQMTHSLLVKNKLKYSVQYFEVERSRIILKVQWPNILIFLVNFFSVFTQKCWANKSETHFLHPQKCLYVHLPRLCSCSS